MKTLIFLGLLVLAVTVRSAEDELTKELSQYQRVTQNKTIGDLASEFVAETKKLGDEVAGFFRNAVSNHSRGGRALNDDESDIDVGSLLSQIAQFTAEQDREARAEEAAAPAAPAESAANEVAPAAETQGAVDTKQYAPPPATYAPPPAPAYAQPKPSYEAPKVSSYGKKKKAVVVAPAPILIPIPGPPGLPGPPGPPGLPGLPGKTPNLRGLKAILLAKIAKLWLLAKAVAVMCLLKFGGNLGLILGLVLPLYGKLKKAGVVLPVQEQQSYEQPAYEEPSYGAPAPSYGAPAPSYGSPAPVPDSYAAPVHQQVVAAVNHGKANYEAPPPPYPARRRR